MRRYTLIFHDYIGYGSYVIRIRRVRCSATVLDRFRSNDSLHYVVSGWPNIADPDGSPAYIEEATS